MFTHLSRDISLLKNTSEKMGHSPPRRPDDPINESADPNQQFPNRPMIR
jgi:hypothetical protein